MFSIVLKDIKGKESCDIEPLLNVVLMCHKVTYLHVIKCHSRDVDQQ